MTPFGADVDREAVEAQRLSCLQQQHRGAAGVRQLAHRAIAQRALDDNRRAEGHRQLDQIGVVGGDADLREVVAVDRGGVEVDAERAFVR